MSASSDPWATDLYLVSETAAERKTRVEAILRNVAAGRYEVPAADVADAVVAFFSRSLEPPSPMNPGSSQHSC